MNIVFGMLALICFAGFVYFVLKYFKALRWHNYGGGEREARAEYGRILRESPESQDARLSEAEFVNRFVSQHPGITKYILLVAACIGLGVVSFILTILTSLGD